MTDLEGTVDTETRRGRIEIVDDIKREVYENSKEQDWSSLDANKRHYISL